MEKTTGTQLRTRSFRGRRRAIAKSAEKNTRNAARRRPPGGVRSASSYTPHAVLPGTPIHAHADPATERTTARRGTRLSRKERPERPQRAAVIAAVRMSRAGPVSPLAATARTGVAVTYRPASTIDAKRLTCPGHIGATVARHAVPAGDIIVDRQGSAAVDPRHARTTSEAADAVAVTWTPSRSLETPSTAGSGRAGPPSNAHARKRFSVGTHPSYPAWPWFGTRLSHFRAGIAAYASITPQIGKNSSTVPAMNRTGAVTDGAYPRGSTCRRTPSSRGSGMVAA